MMDIELLFYAPIMKMIFVNKLLIQEFQKVINGFDFLKEMIKYFYLRKKITFSNFTKYKTKKNESIEDYQIRKKKNNYLKI